jgi:hypothetical protein
MGIENRLRRLEQEVHAAPNSCPQCNGLIIFEEIAEDGTVSYPHGEPCPACDSRGAGGRIGMITISPLDPDAPPAHVYRLEYDTLDENREISP